MKIPNFFLIGAMRSGTTSLYNYLSQHPEIFMSEIKEPNYFACDDKDIDGVNHPYTICNFKEYIALFTNVDQEKAIGEASHTYLYSSLAPKRIFDFNSEAKILVILRNPAERAFSHYLFLRRLGYETAESFEKALELEEERVKKRKGFGHYIRRGFYFRQLKRWYDIFPKNQIKVCLYDDLQKDPLTLIQNIYKFLEVDPYFKPDISLKSHPSGIVRNKFLYSLYRYGQKKQKLIKKLLPSKIYLYLKKVGYYVLNKSIKKPQLRSETKKKLIEIYKEDILNLQGLIERDLSNWLKV